MKKKRWVAAVLSLGLIFSSVPFQTVQAARDVEDFDIDAKNTSSFKFETEDLSKIEYALMSDRDDVRVQLNFDKTSKAVQDISTITVPKSTLQAIEKSGRKATFEIYSDKGKEYAWVFSSGKLDKPVDINLALKATSVSAVSISDPITINSMAVQIKYSAEFPKNTELIIPVDKGTDTKETYPIFYDENLDYAVDNDFYLYKLSGSKLSFETNTKYHLDDDDYEFTIPISKGGSYVLSPTNLKLPNSNGGSSSSGTTDSVQLSSYYGTVGIGGTASIFIQKPTSGTFTVTSGNPNVAQVLGSGTAVNGGTQYQVQGLSAGTSVFTVKSSNGTTTSYTLTVTSASTPTNKSGWVMIDTLSYQFAPGKIYDYKVTLSGASANEVQTVSSRSHIASVKELRRVTRSDGLVDVYYRITALRASADPTTVSSTVRGVHSSIRVMVTAGVKQNGVAARNLSYFTS